MLKLILFEDEHLLVVNKPAGMNTHSPAPYAGEGLFDWLRHREPRWGSLAILQRLDKETSGVLVFAKTPLANRSLAAQFARHEVHKEYLLMTDGQPPAACFTVTSSLVRAGDHYVSRPPHAGSEQAITRFTVKSPSAHPLLLVAEPVTGRTHQIRAQAAARGIPILGDTPYGGSPAPRLCLHAAKLEFRHPQDARPLCFQVPVDFAADSRRALREALIDPSETDAYRLLHGAGDGWPGWYVDRLGHHLLSQAEETPSREARERLDQMLRSLDVGAPAAPDGPIQDEGDAGGPEPKRPWGGAYHKLLDRNVRRLEKAAASPRHLLGAEVAAPFHVRENGLSYELSFAEGYSVGLFLDQRDNRRRFLTGHVAAGFPLRAGDPAGGRLLNTFAYTCAFAVCAAQAGFHTTNLDLSKKYLEWGRRNFRANGLNSDAHDFIYGDAFDWLGRLRKKERRFDVVVLDPPAFSHSRQHGLFRAEREYAGLVRAALPLLAPQGVLLASANVARLAPEAFVETVEGAIRAAGRPILQEHYAPQPPDFPVTRAEPAHLKTLWVRVG
jgi:23S rRNA (cytosine1962-C5)-methyltransferase